MLKKKRVGEMINISNIYKVLVVVLLFQILRNVNLYIYTFIYLSISAFLFIILIKNSQKLNFYSYSELLFFIIYGFLPILTIINSENISDCVISISRYIVMFLFFVICIFIRKVIIIDDIYTIYCRFISLSSLSIIYQIIFGSISFFASSSVRDGLERYSSLCGSLTVFGTASVFALMLLYFCSNLRMKKKEKIAHYFIIISGMVCSQQKASIINLLIFFIFVVYDMFKNGKIMKLLYVFFIIFLFISIVIIFFHDSLIYKYIESTIGYSLGSNNYSISTTDDLLNRLFELPKKAYLENELMPINIVFGKGLTVYAGTVGLEKYTMCHNNFFTLLFSGGILYLVSFLSILCINVKKKKRSINNQEGFILLIILNMLIGGLEFFQPVIGVFIFSFLIIDKNKKKDIKIC